MTHQRNADRLLEQWLSLEAPSAPTELLDDITAVTSRTRPRPAWLARLEGHHMDVITGGRRDGVPRLGLVVAILALLVAAVAVAIGVGSRQGPAVVPPASQSAVASEAPSMEPQATPRMRTVQPGDPVPTELLGAWWDSDRWAYYLAPGDPYCVERWLTTQNCLVYRDATTGEMGTFAEIPTIVEGKLRFQTIADSSSANCRNEASLFTYEITDNALNYTIEPNSCFTGIGNLVRPGAGDAPASAPPPPTP
jgi:hypothetical protein